MIRISFPPSICHALLLVICCGVFAGCSAQRPAEPAAFTLVVTVAGQPTRNVRVRLVPEEDRQAAVCYEGVTDAEGKAGMKVTGTGNEYKATTFVVVCESLGDWRVIPPWSNAQKSPLTIKWNGEETLSVDLPAKAARRL